MKSWDYIDTLGLDSGRIEKMLEGIDLRVQGAARSAVVEDGMKLPLFNVEFYTFLKENGALPTPQEFVESYEAKAERYVRRMTYDTHAALKGRLLRTYPSLVRDVHFYHFLRESGCFEKVLFVLKYDIEEKVDSFVKYRGEWYGLQLYINTARSRSYAALKPGRRPSNSRPITAKLVPLPISLRGAYTVETQGEDLYLYHRRELDSLLTTLDTQYA